MNAFWANMTGWQKILVLVILVVATILFRDEIQTFFEFVVNLVRAPA